MNDNERDRSGDGAGPVAIDDGGPVSADEGGPDRRFLRHSFLIIGWLLTFLTSAVSVFASSHSTLPCPHLSSQPNFDRYGLSLTVSAGTLLVPNKQAQFYSGRPENVNNILRILHSQSYGPSIWSHLTEMNLISSAVGSYAQLQIDEYGQMRYRMAIAMSVGLRYDYPNGWGWLLNCDYAKLQAVGAFNISANNGTGVLSNQNQFVTCAISGSEKRSSIDLGLNRQVKLNNGMTLDIQGGATMVNTRVLSSDIYIAGLTYNILDLWNGASPSPYSQPLPYINQGGIGFGGFGGVALGYVMDNHDALTIGYSFHYAKIPLQGYESYQPQHLISLRFEVGNFNFLDRLN